MAKLWVKTLNITANPSGAAAAARQGNVVMVIDVIDMSTTAEAALEAGAIDILGASLDYCQLPVTVKPEKIGYIAGKKALKYGIGIVIASEPRLSFREDERRKNVQRVIKGIQKAGGNILDIIPNMGKEVVELIDFKDKILVIASSAGGAAYDAAYNYGSPEVLTDTIARTRKMAGDKPAKIAARRAIEAAIKHRSGITIVASSSNSMEDVMAANFIGQEIIKTGFLNIDFSLD